MHIGFDISQTGDGKAGCGYFTHAMIQAMIANAPQHRYALYPSFGDFFLDTGMPAICAYVGKHIDYGPRHSNIDTARAFWTQSELDKALGQPDIIHSNNFWTPVQIASSRLIYTLYDVGFTVDPEWTTEVNRVGCFDGLFRSAVAADWVVAISDYSRTKYLEMFPHFPADRIRVAHPCSRFTDADRQGIMPAAANHLAPNSFWLSVGTIEPRKNQRMLVEAYRRYLESGGPTMPLVLAGGNGWLMDDFKSYVSDLGLSESVIMTGYVSDDEMIWLYRNCYASLYPSVFEGFGLPVLEAMQFGAATICSNTTSMPEVAGDAGILLSPYEPDSWTRTMFLLAVDSVEQQRRKLAARERAKQFDRKRSAAAILDLYQDAMSAPKRRDLQPLKPSKSDIARVEHQH